MWIYRLCLFVCVFVAVLAIDAPAPAPSKEVTTTSGPVRGFLGPSGVYEFFDIPYASAPLGPNKFGPPLPPPVWQETRDAVDTGIMCPQPVLPIVNEENKTMVEDCLVASVFAPVTTQDKLPVVVYVHGGAFMIGDGNMAKPYDLVKDHNVVGVTFNYRLGAHGFLCLGTDDVPGNAGMKDQVALLRWVQRNIDSFGGNPDDVTIAGFSAGSASVDLLMLSKSAEGLFKNVIPESGANIAVFTIQAKPLEYAKWFAQSLNFDNVDDINALEQFYKTATFEQLNSFLILMLRPNLTLPFSPCIERPLTSVERANGKEVFLDQSPMDILKNGSYKKVPLLYGFAEMEGLFYVGMFDTWKTLMNEKFSDFLPGDLVFENEEEKETVAQNVKEFYFGERPVDNDSILSYLDYFTDAMYAYPMLRSARIQVENGHDEIYLYDFNYADEQSTLVPYANIRGADHCDQSLAVFGGQMAGGNRIMTEHYKRLTSTVQQIWANFIKTGKPVVDGSDLPSWPAVTSNWTPHMSIGDELQLKGSLLFERATFWEDIYSKYYREPIPPISVDLEGNSAGRSSVWMSYPVLILLAVFRGRFGL